MDFGAAGLLLGGALGAGGGGYSNTAEGKVIVAAFTDSFNGMVRAVRQYRAQGVAGGLGTGGQLGGQGVPARAGRDDVVRGAGDGGHELLGRHLGGAELGGVAAQAHDDDAVGDRLDVGHVVADEDDAEEEE